MAYHTLCTSGVRKKSRAIDIATARASQVEPVSLENCVSSHAADNPAAHHVLSTTARISSVPQIMPPGVPSINKVSPFPAGISGVSRIVTPGALVPGVDYIRPAKPELNMARASVPVAPSLVSVPGVHYVVPPLNGASHVDYVALLLAAKDSTR